MASYAKLLTIRDVVELGCALVKVADAYPLAYRTERDFYPLVMAYLEGRVPNLRSELRGDSGSIDFRIGGNNPSVLELAVAPRDFVDRHDPELVFRGHQQATHLYARSNRTELVKLSSISTVKARYLLLLNLRSPVNVDRLREGYERELPADAGHNAVTESTSGNEARARLSASAGSGKGVRRAMPNVALKLTSTTAAYRPPDDPLYRESPSHLDTSAA